MEINVDRLTAGMVLQKDVVGKSGKPIVPKYTTLTDLHINFIKKFLIEKVSVSPSQSKNDQETVEDILESTKENQMLTYLFNQSVQEYQAIFQRVKNNAPLEMHFIREKWIPIFTKVADQSIKELLSLMDNPSTEEKFYRKNVVVTFLSVALMKKIGYEKKDWLQVGFAALLSDIGVVHVANDIHAVQGEQWRLHPIYSYKLIENEMMLNKLAKLAILQHHEYLDGSGFPTGTKQDKIHPYAQIIALSDYVVTEYDKKSLNQVISLLNIYKHNKFSKNMVEALMKEIKE